MIKNKLVYWLKRLYFFGKTYINEIITAFAGVALVIVSVFYSSDAKMALSSSFLVIFLSMMVIIFFKTREKTFYFIGMHNLRDKNEWIGNGWFEFVKSEYSFLITDASPGYIFSKCLTWGNYKYEFSFKILNDVIGVVLRAVNLSNYVMLQITPGGIRPHLNINGGWKVWESDTAGLTFEEKLSLDKWYRCKISCERNEIFLTIHDKKREIFCRNWTIPRGILLFRFEEDLGRLMAEKPVSENTEVLNSKQVTTIPLPINLEYGSVGFRNWGHEKALVKDIYISKF